MDAMSIANLSTSMAASQSMSRVGMAVMSMAINDAEAAGANTVAMLNSMPGPALENSVNPSVGGNIDISV